jgi:urocanate hydratase
MSGAQGKAGKIAGAVAVIAEVNRKALDKRVEQGWIDEVHDTVAATLAAVAKYRTERRAIAIAYSGNIVDLLEAFADHAEATGENLAEIISDQTSCHAIEACGYTPCGLDYDAASDMASRDGDKFIGNWIFFFFFRKI